MEAHTRIKGSHLAEQRNGGLTQIIKEHYGLLVASKFIRFRYAEQRESQRGIINGPEHLSRLILSPRISLKSGIAGVTDRRVITRFVKKSTKEGPAFFIP